MMDGHPLFFSVIVPTYSRPRSLARCLEALAAQDFPMDRFEVIVVDDGSAKPRHGVVAALKDRLTLTLRQQEHAGPGTARNTGAQHARNRVSMPRSRLGCPIST